MAFSLVGHVEAHPGASGGTSSSLDTSGANFIVISVASGGNVTVSDSKGNKYSPEPQVSSGSIRNQFFRCESPVVGTGHTFTVAGSAVYPCFHVLAFSGAQTFPSIQHSSAGSSGTSQAAGSITPPANNYLLVTSTAVSASSSGEAVDSPFSSNSYYQNFSGGVNYGGGIAYEIQTTATSRNPTWSGSSVSRAVAVMSVEVSSAYSGWTPIARVQGALGANGGTTAAIDTTGADFIVIAVSKYQANAVTVSDNKSNPSPTALTEYGSQDRVRLYYWAAPSVGSGHTFTISGSGVYPGVQVIAFSGSHASPYDQTNGAYSTNSTSQASGSLTPPEDNCLVVTGLGSAADSPTEAVDSPFFAHSYYQNTIAGTSEGVGIAYEIQTTATARNPTWSGVSSGSGRDRSVTIATFKRAAGGSTFTASAAVTIGAATCSGSGTFTKPTYTGAGAVTAAPAVAAGVATFAVNTFTATAAVTAPKATASGSATFTKPTYTAAAAVTVGATTAAGSATFTKPIYTGTVGATIGPATCAGVATFTKPVFTAAGAVTVGKAVCQGSAIFASAVFQGAANVTVAGAQCSGVATFDGSGVAVLVYAPARVTALQVNAGAGRQQCTNAGVGRRVWVP